MCRFLINIICFSTVLFSCKKENNKAMNIVNKESDFKEINLEINYGNNSEIKKIKEKIIPINSDGKFKLISEIENGIKNDSISYFDEWEIDINKNKCVKQLSIYNKEKNKFKNYKRDTLSALVEDKLFTVQGNEYPVYKIIEKDWDVTMCKIRIVSPQFGFLFERSDVGSYVVNPTTSDPVIMALIEEIKKDKPFSTCGN